MMKLGLYLMICICVHSFAFSGRDSGTSGNIPRQPEPWSGNSGKGAHALFIFLAFDDYLPDSVYASGDCYWNPLFQESGTGWSLNSICESWSEPAGSPYHWNGGLGTALNSLGYSWHWFPGYTGRCGQVIPDPSTLAEYECIFVMTFDAYSGTTVTPGVRSVLQTCMENGGSVVLVSQDALYSGVPETWLMEWFDSGSITGDVVSGTSPFSASGIASSFLVGWSGTALMENFSTGAAGTSEGSWWADDLSGNGCLSNGSYTFASCSEYYGSIFSTFDFEACSPGEVQSIAGHIMSWTGGSSLQRSTWGEIKTEFTLETVQD